MRPPASIGAHGRPLHQCGSAADAEEDHDGRRVVPQSPGPDMSATACSIKRLQVRTVIADLD
jgi:hypothetical protein